MACRKNLGGKKKKKRNKAGNSEKENLIFCLLGAAHETLKDPSCWQCCCRLLMCTFIFFFLGNLICSFHHTNITALQSSARVNLKDTLVSLIFSPFHNALCSNHMHQVGLLSVDLFLSDQNIFFSQQPRYDNQKVMCVLNC